jgi:hypothetical protein
MFSDLFKKTFKKVSIKQTLFIVVIICCCSALSMKNTNATLYRLQETSFNRVLPFIERKAFLLDQLTLLVPDTPPTIFRSTFRHQKYSESLLFFLLQLTQYESKLNEKIVSIRSLRHALKSNNEQLTIQLTQYNANATAYNQLHDKKSYFLFFKVVPYSKAPVVDPTLLTLNTLVVNE